MVNKWSRVEIVDEQSDQERRNDQQSAKTSQPLGPKLWNK